MTLFCFKHKVVKDFLFDDDGNSISTLKSRIGKLGNVVSDIDLSIDKKDFSDSTEIIQSYDNRNNGVLVVIDPVGFKVSWKLMKKILNARTADVIFTFMTHIVTRHRSNYEQNNNYGKLLTEFFGDEEWKSYLTGEALISLYINKPKQYKRYVPAFLCIKQVTRSTIIY